MPETIVISDIDGTMKALPGQPANCDDETLKQKIQQAQDKGIILGLNTDTDGPRIQRLCTELKLRGPLISERGSCVHLPGQETPLWHHQQSHDLHLLVNSAIINFIFREFIAEAEITHIQDSAKIIDEMRRQTPYPRILIFDVRKYSFNFVIIKDFHGLNPQDDPMFRRFTERLQAKLNELNASDYLVETYPYTNFIQAFYVDASKGSPVDFLLKHYGVKKIFMIGDYFPFDFLNHPQVIQCAVANAAQPLKDRSQFVAAEKFTLGFFQCIDWISQQR